MSQFADIKAPKVNLNILRLLLVELVAGFDVITQFSNYATPSAPLFGLLLDVSTAKININTISIIDNREYVDLRLINTDFSQYLHKLVLLIPELKDF